MRTNKCSDVESDGMAVYTCALFSTACSIFLLYLDDVMGAFEKKRVSHLGVVF